MGIIKRHQAKRRESRQVELYRSLIRREAKIGGQLFGDVPKGRRREFFCLDEYTWVWHEEWTDDYGERKTRTTRYDVKPAGIYKAQEGQPYQMLSLDEARNLYRAAAIYEQRINDELYNAV